FYSVELSKDRVVHLNVAVLNPTADEHQQFDPVVGLFNPAGQLMATNDDAGSGGRWAAGLSYAVNQTGTWTVAVSDYPDFAFTGQGSAGDGFGTDTGAYVLTVEGGKVDIKVKDAAFSGTTQTLVFHYATDPDSFKGTFDAG